LRSGIGQSCASEATLSLLNLLLNGLMLPDSCLLSRGIQLVR